MIKQKTSKYAVPDEIKKLKPTEFPCLWKTVFSSDHLPHYYLYEQKRVPDPKNPGKMKNASGMCIGKFEGGMVVLNDQGRKRYPDYLRHTTASPDSSRHTVSPDSSRHTASPEHNAKLKYQDLQTKDYGAYAAVISSTRSVYDRLENYFELEVAIRLYAMSVAYFVDNYMPAGSFYDAFHESILSDRWPALPVRENDVGEFLETLGRYPAAYERYSQSLIEDSGKLIAIDGRGIRSSTASKEFAAYDHQYRLFGAPEVHVVQIYDAENHKPLSSCLFDGGGHGMTEGNHLFSSCQFRNKTFLVGPGFYSEPNIGMFRKDGNHFVVPVPARELIAQAGIDLSFSKSFLCEGKDSSGKGSSGKESSEDDRNDVILYKSYLVEDLEKMRDERFQKEEELRYASELERYNKGQGEKPRPRKGEQEALSQYKKDQIFIYRDETVHASMRKEYCAFIDIEDGYTEQALQAEQDWFGVFVLRTDRKEDTAQDTFLKYKKRGRMETNDDVIKNCLDFERLDIQNHYILQGLGFLSVLVGQIRSEYGKRIEASSFSSIRSLSIQESMRMAARLKITKHQDQYWYLSTDSPKVMNLMSEMGVSIERDMNRLNEETAKSPHSRRI